MQLYYLTKAAMGPNSIIIGHNTDSVFIANPNPNIKLGTEIGDYRQEQKYDEHGNCLLKPKGGNITKIYPPYQLPIKEWKVIDEEEFDKIDALDYCLIRGEGGCGKTTLVKKLFDNSQKETMILYFMNRHCAALREKGVPKENVSTLHKFFNVHEEGIEATLEKMKNFDRFIVDEFSCLSMEHLLWILRLKEAGKSVFFVGDQNQTLPIDIVRYLYLKSDFFQELCGSNRVDMEYKSTTGRYDENLRKVAHHILRNSPLPVFQQKQERFDDVWTFIVKDNKTRCEINEKKIERWNEGAMEVFQIGKKEIGIECPLICKKNDTKFDIYNGDIFKLKGVDEKEGIVLLSEGRKVPIKYFHYFFDLAFAITVYRIQGSTIEDDYVIVNLDRFSRNEAYVAMTRGRSLENVHWNGSQRIHFRKDVTWNVANRSPKEGEEEFKSGKIYLIKENGDPIYVGSTVQSLEKRFQEHCSAVDSSKIHQEVDWNNCTIELLHNYPTTSRKFLEKEEKKYINLIGRDFELVNTKLIDRQPMTKIPKIKRVNEVMIKSSGISKMVDNLVEKTFRVYYKIEGKSKQKKFGYARIGKGECQKKIKEFEEML